MCLNPLLLLDSKSISVVPARFLNTARMLRPGLNTTEECRGKRLKLQGRTHGVEVQGRMDDVCRFAASASGHGSTDALSRIVSERPSLVSVGFTILRGSNVAHESEELNKKHIR